MTTASKDIFWRLHGGAKRGGFTLVELMITIVVVVILGTLAAPSFVEYIANQRLRNASNDLISALQIARSEAIKRNADVDVVRTVSTNWTSGWKVQFAGAAIRVQDGFNKLSITDSANLSTISYGNDGRAKSVPTIFKIQPAVTINSVTARCVTISLSGIPTSTLGGC